MVVDFPELRWGSDDFFEGGEGKSTERWSAPIQRSTQAGEVDALDVSDDNDVTVCQEGQNVQQDGAKVARWAASADSHVELLLSHFE